ncbi:acetyltransferase [Oceanirhabdus sp. W0125-5]|uniref:acetyltransferase n=1 Tax=Oceanirhabdus sp. W0125-5 TaxID=2999116 RepID=UPI0022F2AA2B|nr:acetyltransferase [Oceanirhabdus sp. W0125-5]WBW98946.1 acetyltransferase [Oceanirhabdus sp. W0125-5]
MKDILIIGSGGVGKEVALLIEQINEYKPTWNLLGFLDDNKDLHNTVINGYKVLGNIDLLHEYKDINAICAIANYKVKKQIINKLRNNQIKFPNIIHPSICLSKTTYIGEGVIIYPGVVMTSNIEVGDYVILSPKCGIGHESIIKDYVSLLWNVNVSGNVIIEEGCLLGSGSTILQNKKIGRGSIVGAGAVVTKDIPDNSIAVGCPAKVIKNY